MNKFLPHVFFISLMAFGQAENPNYAGKAMAFQQAYNNGNYTAIFEMFDVNMKQALPLEQARDFFTENVKRSMGDILQMRFLEIKNGGHIYRTRFDKAVTDVLLSLNMANEINGLYIFPPRPLDVPIIERNSTLMQLPFEGEWYVFWGGTSLNDNYHIAYENQKYAYDLVMMKDGATFSGNAKKNESYFAFGQEIHAPCNARVVEVIEGIKDNRPGEMNSYDTTGNTIILQTDQDEYLLFAHLKEDSIVVEEGEEVNTGDLLGLCGNSGNSSEPHLHLSLQNVLEMVNAVGGKLYFDTVLVNGETQRDYLPKKGEYISNSN